MSGTKEEAAVESGNHSESMFFTLGLNEVAYLALQMDFSFPKTVLEFQEALKILGHRSEFLVMDQYDLSSLLPDGNWTGPMGHVQRNEADMILQPMFLSEEMPKHADISTFFMYMGIMLLSKSNSNVRVNDMLMDAFLKTNPMVILLFLFTVWILSSLAHAIGSAARILHRGGQEQSRTATSDGAGYVDTVISTCLSLSVPARESGNRADSATRIVAFTLSYLVFTFSTFAGIFVTTTLVVKDDSQQVDSIQDVVRNSKKFRLYVTDREAVGNLFESGATEEFRKILQMQRHWKTLSASNEEQVEYCGDRHLAEAILRKRAVWMHLREGIVFCAKEYCEVSEDIGGGPFHLSRAPVAEVMLGFVQRKNLSSRKKDVLNMLSSFIRERGVLHYWQRRILYDLPKCMNDESPEDEFNEAMQLSLATFRTTFFVWVAGICAALLLLAAELLRARLRGNRKRIE